MNHVEPDNLAAGLRPAVANVGNVIAAVPHLLGFYPRTSLVLLALDGAGAVLMTYRVDLPEARHVRELTDELYADIARRRVVRQVVAVVVGGEEAGPGGVDALLALELRTGAARAGVGILVLGVPRIAAQARWFEYGVPDVEGRVPDPELSTMRTAAVGRGLVTFAGREELAALVRADPEEDLDRRAGLYEQAVATSGGVVEGEGAQVAERRFQTIQRQVERAVGRREPLTDAEIVELGVALSDHQVRDWCLAFALEEYAAGAESLWLELTRSLPRTVCAEAAVLAALFAYVRGDGALARIVIDKAKNTPLGARHRLTQLVDSAVGLGMEPTRLRSVCESARRSRHQATGRS